MDPIGKAQHNLLERMNRFAEAASGPAIRPPSLDAGNEPGGIAVAFEDALRAVDAQQHQAGAAMAAVDSGRSDDLMGAMLQSQKASLSFSALVQVRNKLTTAFEDIIRMPV